MQIQNGQKNLCESAESADEKSSLRERVSGLSSGVGQTGGR
jgi:hypothetical protein